MAAATSSLPHARLAEDQHREVGRRGLAATLEHATHALAHSDERSELRDLRDVDLLGLRRVELQRRITDGQHRVLGEVDLAHTCVADERAVPRPEVTNAHPSLGRDKLSVNRADLAVVENEVAGLVPANHLRLRSDVQGRLVCLPAVHLQRTATDLEPTLGYDGSIHGFALYHASVRIRQEECSAGCRFVWVASWVACSAILSSALFSALFFGLSVPSLARPSPVPLARQPVLFRQQRARGAERHKVAALASEGQSRYCSMSIVGFLPAL